MSWFPCCCADYCEDSLVVAVYNCNGITDDNFSLAMNGSTIVTNMPETITLNCGLDAGFPCRGHLVRASGVTAVPDVSAFTALIECGCFDTPSWSTYTADELRGLTSAPLFRLTSIFDNFCFNFGYFIVYCWDGATLTQIFAQTYSMDPLSFQEYQMP